MNFNDLDEQDQLQPVSPFQKVFLMAYPKIEDKDGKKAMLFTYVNKKKAVREFRIFDIYNQKPDLNEKVAKANQRQFVAVLTCMMPPESAEEWKKGDYKSMEEAVEQAKKFFDPDWQNLSIDLVFGYGKSGYAEIPIFGHAISTKHRERTLVYPANLSLMPVERKAAKPDKEADDNDDEDI